MIDKYKSVAMQKHKGLKITPVSLILKNKKPALGHLHIHSCNVCMCCSNGVLEVKCPYCAQMKGLEEVVKSNKQFFLIKDSEANMMLNCKHSYYYQCQMQMYVTDTSYCDFVVWSETGDLFCERLLPDTGIILEQLHLAEKFFYLAILPELLGKRFTRDHTALPTVTMNDESDEEEDNGSWGYCQEAKGGDMIECENSSCSIKWFHMECLRIKQGKDSKGRWLCRSCYAVQDPQKTN